MRWILLFLLLPSVAAAAPWSPETRQGVDAYNQGIELLNGQNPKGAEAKFRKCTKKEPGVGLCGLYQAIALTRIGRAEKAVPLLRQVAADFPEQDSPLGELSTALFGLEQFDEAKGYALAALKLNPAETEHLNRLVTVLLRTGEYDEGLAAVERSRGQLPDADLACQEASILIQRGQPADARELLVACRESKEAYLITNAEARYTTATGERTRGAAAMDAVLDPKSGPLGQTIEAYNLGEWAEAERAATRAIQAGEGSGQALVLRAMSRERQGKAVLALADFDKALESGTWIDVHRSGAITGIITKTAEERLFDLLRLGAATQVELLSEQGKFERAESALEQGRAAFGDNAQLIAAEGRLRLEQGRLPEAWAIVRTTLPTGRGSAPLQELASDLALKHLVAASPEDIAALEADGTLSTQFNLGAAFYNAQNPAECLRIFRPLAGTSETLAERSPAGDEGWALRWREDLERDQSRINRLAHDCACRTSEADAAAQLWQLVDPPELSSAISHAILMLNQKRHAEVGPALDRGQAGDATENRSQIVQLYLLGAARAGDLDAALTWAADPAAPQGGRLELSALLGQKKRYAEALSLLTGRCGELQGEAKDVCEQNIKFYAHQLK